MLLVAVRCGVVRMMQQFERASAPVLSVYMSSCFPLHVSLATTRFLFQLKAKIQGLESEMVLMKGEGVSAPAGVDKGRRGSLLLLCTNNLPHIVHRSIPPFSPPSPLALLTIQNDGEELSESERESLLALARAWVSGPSEADFAIGLSPPSDSSTLLNVSNIEPATDQPLNPHQTRSLLIAQEPII